MSDVCQQLYDSRRLMTDVCCHITVIRCLMLYSPVNRPLVERGGEREKRKGLWTDLWGRRSTAPAVHQILMQAPIGENTDCWQVWLTSAFRLARSTRFDHRVAITKQSKDYYHGEELRAPVKRLKLSLKKNTKLEFIVTEAQCNSP